MALSGQSAQGFLGVAARRRGSTARAVGLEQARRRGTHHMQRRKADRAQRIRARRVWWDRNGAFLRGLVTGAAVAAAGAWILQMVMAH